MITRSLCSVLVLVLSMSLPALAEQAPSPQAKLHSVIRGDKNLKKGSLVRSWDEKIDLRGHKEYQAHIHGLAGNRCGYSVDARFRRGKVTWGLKGTLENMK